MVKQLGSGLIVLGIVAACHARQAPPRTVQDVETTQQEAQREIADARVEASKDIKSASKLAGANSPEALHAKVTASYDIAMAKAEGDHKVASEKCELLDAGMIQPCKSRADADYETAKASAKAIRTAGKH